MSRDAGEPRPPRRPKAPSDPSRPPDPPEESTWRPTNRAARPPDRGARSSRRSEDDPAPVAGGPTWSERLVFGSVGTGHLAIFCRQFAAYLDAGVDLVKALASLERQFARTALGPVLGRLQLSIRRGDPLADAMARESKAFDPLLVNIMRVAEARGGVPETLRLMSGHYEARQRLFRQARSAMIYPVIVLIVASAVVALMTLFILPIFVDFLKDIAGKAGEVPLPTRALLAFSAFVQSIGWWLVPLLLVVSIFALFRAYRTPSGKGAIDEVSLYVPVLGKLLRKIDTSRFARTLSALLEGGLDIGSSLDLTAEILHLTPYRRAVRDARAAIVEGTELSEALRDSGRFGPDVIAIVNSGEETGKLPESLDRLADDYEEQVTFMVKNLGSLIQPLIMIALGALVLFIILAVFLPYLSLITSLTR